MKLKLTDAAIGKLRKPDKGQRRIEYFDELVPSTGIAVGAGGKRVFFCYFRRRGGKLQRMTLGEWLPNQKGVTLAKAREAARKAQEVASTGEDPTARKEEVLPDEARESLAAVIADFETYHIDVKLKPRTAASYKSELARVSEKLGKRPITKVTRRDVLDITEGFVKDGKPAQARLTHAILQSFFGWCVQRGILETSPIAGLRAPAKVASRDRVLSEDELRAVWSGSQALPYPFGPVIRLLLLCGQREAETARMRWQDVDDTRLWTLPDTKRGTPHYVTLPKLAQDELKALPRFKDGDYVFTTTGGEKPVSGFSRAKKAIDAELERLHQEDPDQWIEVAPWRFHDLRRTVATNLARLGVTKEVNERLLNHRSGSVSGVAAVYNRWDYRDETAEALAKWAAYVESVVKPKRKKAAAGNVVEFKRP